MPLDRIAGLVLPKSSKYLSDTVVDCRGVQRPVPTLVIVSR